MDPFDAGWLSLLPPIIAITLALITKEVISSLFLGILSGTVIYCLGMGTGDMIIKPVEIAFTTMVNKVDFNIIIFCTLLGALVFTISRAGGTRAYGNWATSASRASAWPCSPPAAWGPSSSSTTISTASPWARSCAR